MHGEGTDKETLLPTKGGCWMCHKGGCDHFVIEWDTFIHATCIPKFLMTAEGQCVIDHGHECVIDFGASRKFNTHPRKVKNGA